MDGPSANLEVIDKINYPIRAVYPLISSEATQEIYRRYKHYEKAYNEKVATANKERLRYNKEVERNWEESENRDWLRGILAKHKSNYRNASGWTYNEKAKEMNLKLGQKAIPLAKIQPLRDVHGVFFKLVVFEYGSQLTRYTRNRRASNSTYVRAIPQVDINTKHLENTKGVDGLFMTSVCPDTLLNRKKRLEEAGVIQNGVYRGPKRGTLHYINPEIMAIYDGFDAKLTTLENQPFTERETKKFRDTVLNTRAISKREIKDPEGSMDKDDVDAVQVRHHTEKNSFPSENFTRTPSCSKPHGLSASSENEKKENGPAAKITEKLRQSVLSVFLLARKLSLGEYTDHSPIDTAMLIEEATGGNMSKFEFRDLLVQELFKLASKLYKGREVYAGEWVKALHMFNNFMLRTPNGEALTKTMALRHYQKLEFALVHHRFGAVKCAQNLKFSVAMPTWYLDPKNKMPGSFAYWYERTMKRYVDEQGTRKKVLERQQLDNRMRGEAYKNTKKLHKKLAQLVKGAISMEELVRYVDYNLPKEYRQGLDQRITEFRNGFNKYNRK
jgi:hypothetical protein